MVIQVMIVFPFREGGSEWKGVPISDTIGKFFLLWTSSKWNQSMPSLRLGKASDICMLIVIATLLSSFRVFQQIPWVFLIQNHSCCFTSSLPIPFFCQTLLPKTPNTVLSINSRQLALFLALVGSPVLILRCWLSCRGTMNYLPISTYWVCLTWMSAQFCPASFLSRWR